jgi:hypothetical protein
MRFPPFSQALCDALFALWSQALPLAILLISRSISEKWKSVPKVLQIKIRMHGDIGAQVLLRAL